MIQSKKELKEFLKYEKKNYGNVPRFWRLLSFLGASEKSIIWRYQTYLRKWEYYLNSKKRIRSAYFKYHATKFGRKYGFSIHPNCFDKGLKIMHAGSILINSGSKIGKDCLINVQTALVSTSGTSASPVIGNNCKIGIGAILVGGIHLGDDVAIGAGAVVVKSFDENHITIAGVPAKIVSRKGIL